MERRKRRRPPDALPDMLDHVRLERHAAVESTHRYTGPVQSAPIQPARSRLKHKWISKSLRDSARVSICHTAGGFPPPQQRVGEPIPQPGGMREKMPGCDLRRVGPGDDVGTLDVLEDGDVVEFWQDAGDGLIEGEEPFVNALE